MKFLVQHVLVFSDRADWVGMGGLFEQRGGGDCFGALTPPRPLPPPNNNRAGGRVVKGGGEMFKRKKDGGAWAHRMVIDRGDMATYNGGRTMGCCDVATRRKRLYMQTCGQLGHFLGTAHCLGTPSSLQIGNRDMGTWEDTAPTPTTKSK